MMSASGSSFALLRSLAPKLTSVWGRNSVNSKLVLRYQNGKMDLLGLWFSTLFGYIVTAVLVLLEFLILLPLMIIRFSGEISNRLRQRPSGPTQKPADGSRQHSE